MPIRSPIFDDGRAEGLDSIHVALTPTDTLMSCIRRVSTCPKIWWAASVWKSGQCRSSAFSCRGKCGLRDVDLDSYKAACI